MCSLTSWSLAYVSFCLKAHIFNPQPSVAHALSASFSPLMRVEFYGWLNSMNNTFMLSLKFIHASIITITTNNFRGKTDFVLHASLRFAQLPPSYSVSLQSQSESLILSIHRPSLAHLSGRFSQSPLHVFVAFFERQSLALSKRPFGARLNRMSPIHPSKTAGNLLKSCG